MLCGLRREADGRHSMKSSETWLPLPGSFCVSSSSYPLRLYFRLLYRALSVSRLHVPLLFLHVVKTATLDESKVRNFCDKL